MSNRSFSKGTCRLPPKEREKGKACAHTSRHFAAAAASPTSSSKSFAMAIHWSCRRFVSVPLRVHEQRKGHQVRGHGSKHVLQIGAVAPPMCCSRVLLGVGVTAQTHRLWIALPLLRHV